MYVCMASGGHLKMPIFFLQFFLFVRDQQLTATENGGVVRLILYYIYYMYT